MLPSFLWRFLDNGHLFFQNLTGRCSLIGVNGDDSFIKVSTDETN